jgi:hypothetical protein
VFKAVCCANAETGAVAALFGAMTLSAIMMPQKQQKHCCVFVQPSGNGSRFFRKAETRTCLT